MLTLKQVDEVRISAESWNHVELELRLFHETKKQIMLRREEIIHPHIPIDVNVGGGKSNAVSDPTGRTVSALESDVLLQNLNRIVYVIEYVYEGLDDEKKELVKLMYWTRPQTLTLPGIALKLNVTDRTVRRWKKEIIYIIAALMGWR